VIDECWSTISKRFCYHVNRIRRAFLDADIKAEKSRGFYLDKSHLSDPQRLGILMIAACLAYLWITYLGWVAIRKDWIKVIHRTDRCDWSVFRLSLALLDYLLNESLPIPVSFTLLEEKSVR
jgi:hypothetical protein